MPDELPQLGFQRCVVQNILVWNGDGDCYLRGGGGGCVGCDGTGDVLGDYGEVAGVVVEGLVQGGTFVVVEVGEGGVWDVGLLAGLQGEDSQGAVDCC